MQVITKGLVLLGICNTDEAINSLKESRDFFLTLVQGNMVY